MLTMTGIRHPFASQRVPTQVGVRRVCRGARTGCGQRITQRLVGVEDQRTSVWFREDPLVHHRSLGSGRPEWLSFVTGRLYWVASGTRGMPYSSSTRSMAARSLAMTAFNSFRSGVFTGATPIAIAKANGTAA